MYRLWSRGYRRRIALFCGVRYRWIPRWCQACRSGGDVGREQGLAAGAGEDRVDVGAVGCRERVVVVADPVETLSLVLEWALAILMTGDLAHDLIGSTAERCGIGEHERDVGASGLVQQLDARTQISALNPAVGRAVRDRQP